MPNGSQPYPKLDGMPVGSVGHVGEHAEHEPIVSGGQIVAAPPGHGVQVKTIPSAEEVEKRMKEKAEEGGRWWAVFGKREGLKKGNRV